MTVDPPAAPCSETARLHARIQELETALSRAEALHRRESALLVGGPIILLKWRHSTKGAITYASPNVLIRFGYPPDQLTHGGCTYPMLLLPEDRDRVLACAEQAVADRRTWYEEEYRVRHADGTFRWVHDFTEVLYNAAGHATGFRSYMEDITERKRTAAALLKRERYLAALNAIGHALLSTHEEVPYQQFVDIVGPTIPGCRLFVTKLVDADAADPVAMLMAEWCDDGIRRLMTSSLAHPLDTRLFQPQIEQMCRDGIAFNTVQSMPSELRSRLCLDDIRSSISIPLLVDGVLLGVMGVQYCNEGYAWSDTDLEFLKGAASYLAQAMLRKQAGDALRESRNHMEVALHGADLGTYDWNLLTGEEQFNPRLAEMLGYRLDEITQHISWWGAIVHPEDLPEVRERITAHQTGQTPSYESEHRLRTKSGGWIWVLDRAKIIERAPDGTPLRMAGTHLDITDRRQAAEDLAAETERLSVTLRSIGDGVITTDNDGRVTLLNRVAEELTGWRQAEAVGRPLEEVFHIVHEYTRTCCENPVKKVLRTGGIVELANHTVLISRAGKEHIIADSGAPIRDRASRIIGVVLVFRDTTQETRMQEELQRHARMESIGLLAGGIAHDFNNLLTVLTGNLGLAQLAVRAGDRVRVNHALQEAETAAVRAKELTQQLLTFARGGNPVREPIDLVPVVMESVKLALSGTRHRARVEEEPVWPVSADAGQISQVLHNLLLNADQAMPMAGEIIVRVANALLPADTTLPLPAGPYVTLTVIDQGVGIPADQREKIFEPFYTTKQRGSGLGLASVYSIIKAHDGYIDVHSHPGEGSTFTLYLPADPDATLEAASAADEAATPVSPLRILVMDDETLIRQMLTEMLTLLGHRVEAVADGDAAIGAVLNADKRGEPIDLLILDLTIPGGKGGKEVVNYLQNNAIAYCAIASSGYATDPILANYHDYGFHGRLAKPYRISELETTIAELTDMITP